MQSEYHCRIGPMTKRGLQSLLLAYLGSSSMGSQCFRGVAAPDAEDRNAEGLPKEKRRLARSLLDKAPASPMY